MHGTFCKAVETFIIDRHGAPCWRAIVAGAKLDFDHFETTRRYDAKTLEAVLASAAAHLDVVPLALLEDIGTWVCTHPPLEPIRRLFRFSGATFEDMLFSLEEVHERAAMALPDLRLPVFSLSELGDGRYRVASTWTFPGASAVLSGVLRAMADDYGVLAFLDTLRVVEANGAFVETISVQLLDDRFAPARDFQLGGAA